jgi:Uncharacterised nucleotidyltransferase
MLQVRPGRLLSQLRMEFYGNSLRNLHLARELVKLSNLLECQGVAAVAFKGPVPAATVYGDLALRQFIDLDILVRRSDLSKAIETLTAQRYTLAQHRRKIPEITSFQASEDVFRKQGGSTIINLHWEMTPRYFPFTPDPDSIVERSIQVRLEAGEVRTLATQELMLFQCAHATKHAWPSLGSICDVAHCSGQTRPWIGHGWLRKPVAFAAGASCCLDYTWLTICWERLFPEGCSR